MQFCPQKMIFENLSKQFFLQNNNRKSFRQWELYQLMQLSLGESIQLFQFSVSNLYLHPHATDLWQYLLRHDMIELDSALLMLIKENRWSV